MSTVDNILLRQALVNGRIQHSDSAFDDLSFHALPSTGGGAFNTTVHRVSSAADGWTVVVKQMTAKGQDWSREVEAYDDAWLRSTLPGGLRIPQVLASERSPAGATLILEHLPAVRPADVSDLATAAELLTNFSASHNDDIRPWWSTGRLATEFQELSDHPDRVAERRLDPAVEALRTQLQALNRQAPNLLEVLTTLPQGPAHLDAFSRNLVVTQDAIGVVDWANAGAAPIGTDPATLFVLSLDYLDTRTSTSTLAGFESHMIDAMIEGLPNRTAASDAKRGFDAVARLRHLAMMMNALPMVESGDPAVTAIVGRPIDEIMEQWIAVGDHLLRST